MLDFLTNAACPQNPSWSIIEVGYAWARTVYGLGQVDSSSVEMKPDDRIHGERKKDRMPTMTANALK